MSMMSRCKRRRQGT